MEVVNEVEAKKDDADFQEDEHFKLNVFFMERLLNQNTYQPKQARYRGLKPILSENDGKIVDLILIYDDVFFLKLFIKLKFVYLLQFIDEELLENPNVKNLIKEFKGKTSACPPLNSFNNCSKRY